METQQADAADEAAKLPSRCAGHKALVLVQAFTTFAFFEQPSSNRNPQLSPKSLSPAS